VLRRVMDTARWAPSGCNFQPVGSRHPDRRAAQGAAGQDVDHPAAGPA
jgi:hypothetical protein